VAVKQLCVYLLLILTHAAFICVSVWSHMVLRAVQGWWWSTTVWHMSKVIPQRMPQTGDCTWWRMELSNMCKFALFGLILFPHADTFCFEARHCIRLSNMGLVFVCLFCVIVSVGLLMCVWFSCVRFSFFIISLRDWLGRMSPGWLIFMSYVSWNLNQISQFIFIIKFLDRVSTGHKKHP